MGDTVRFKPEYQTGYHLNDELFTDRPSLSTGPLITNADLTVMGGPFCDSSQNNRFWLFKVTTPTEFTGWFTDGIIQNGAEYQWFEVIELGHSQLLPDGVCPAEPALFQVGDSVSPGRNDTRLYGLGPWVQADWVEWEFGKLVIIQNPVCHESYRYWYAYDPFSHVGGWVMDTYFGEVNLVLAAPQEPWASPEAGYSSWLLEYQP